MRRYKALHRLMLLILLVMTSGWLGAGHQSGLATDFSEIHDKSAITVLDIDSLEIRCINATFTGEYAEAHWICDRLEEIVCGPLPAFYRSALLSGEMIDYEDTLGMGRFFAESQRCIDLAQARIDSGNEVADDYFYLGSVLAYRSLFWGHIGSYWKTYRAAVKSRRALERCLEMDSSYIDARVGIGNFQYWMSKSFDFVNWLPVMRDEKDDGIAQLEMVIAAEPKSKYLAISSLANIQLDRGEYMEALHLARLGKARYPGSRVFLWQEGAAALNLGLYTFSNRIYEALLRSVSSEERNNHYNEISCYRSLVEGYYHLEEWDTCIKLAQRALDIPLSEDVQSQKKRTLEEIRDYLERAVQKRQSVKAQSGSHGKWQ
jgi:tetratricopeptide (TPR) repeat protein